jgi:transaldolase
MKKLQDLNVKIFSDGADKKSMLDMYKKNYISGFTTNPTLMRKAGVLDYRNFCKDILNIIKDKPLSFEVFSDDFKEMERQAMEISSWGNNVYVKIPVTNTKQKTSRDLIKELVKNKIKVNVTAIMTITQVKDIIKVLDPNLPSYISIFAGRVADTGQDPVPMITEAVEMVKNCSLTEIIWASPRELLNIFQADTVGCHIITVTSDILKKLNLLNYNLEKYSLETVQMFYDDAVRAGFKL